MMSKASPFLKKDLQIDREPTFFEKVCSYITRKSHETFVKSIPSDDIRDMPPQFMYPLGFFVFILLVSVFLVIFLLSYNLGIKTQVLAPLSDGEVTASSQYCKTISLSNSGMFTATHHENTIVK
jgi:hypothetical protein